MDEFRRIRGIEELRRTGAIKELSRTGGTDELRRAVGMEELRRNRGNTMDLMAFGEAVRRWRVNHGMSQRQLARRIDLSQATVSRLERGLLPGIRLWRIVTLLGVMGFGRARSDLAAG